MFCRKLQLLEIRYFNVVITCITAERSQVRLDVVRWCLRGFGGNTSHISSFFFSKAICYLLVLINAEMPVVSHLINSADSQVTWEPEGVQHASRLCRISMLSGQTGHPDVQGLPPAPSLPRRPHKLDKAEACAHPETLRWWSWHFLRAASAARR